MPLSRPLPPLFLLPAWSYRQLHSGPAWVHKFAPNSETSDRKSAALNTQDVQETLPAQEYKIKKHVARAKVRTLGVNQGTVVRRLPTNGARSQDRYEKFGVSHLGSGRGYRDSKIEDNPYSEDLASSNSSRNDGQRRVATRKARSLASDKIPSTPEHYRTVNGSPGWKGKQAVTSASSREKKDAALSADQKIRWVVNKKGVEHVELRNGNMTVPNSQAGSPPADSSEDAGDAEKSPIRHDSYRSHARSIADVRAVDADELQISSDYRISIPWPAVRPEHSAQAKNSSLGLSTISSPNTRNNSTTEADSAPRESTSGLHFEGAPSALPNASQTTSSDTDTKSTPKKPMLKSPATAPVAKLTKSSSSGVVSLTRDRYPKESKRLEPTPHTPPISLLEELFPAEAKRHRKEREITQKAERQIPRLLLSADMSDLDNPRAALGRVSKEQAALKNEIRTRRQQYLKDFRRKEISVILLGSASKSLIEDDFRRISPQGKHVEGWKGEGDILKVIPRRDPNTLEALGEYLLLFSSPSSASAYHNHVRQQHQLSRTHTPKSLTSPIAPPSGYILDGQDIHALLQDYALKPPSQNLNLKRLPSPLSPFIRNLVTQGGYPTLLTTESKSQYPILFSIDGSPQPTTHAIKEAIGKDGRKRGLLWALSTSSDAIRKFEYQDTSPSPTPIPPTTTNETLEPSPQTNQSNENNESSSSSKPDSQSRYRKPRWIISFQSDIEAQRFVRSWHRTSFPAAASRGSAGLGEVDPIVNVEVLW
ncbi:MAG: hypothetical protein M1812_002500 [Candelaria pacifica]|nr:MAG: hypothetical protein M1812_002500 [Candelaria pacifica]